VGLKAKLDKLERQAKHHHDELRSPDGPDPCYDLEKVFAALDALYGDLFPTLLELGRGLGCDREDVLAALGAAAYQEEHCLLARLLEMDPQTGIPGHLRALMASPIPRGGSSRWGCRTS
jgi:hypothetical protein